MKYRIKLTVLLTLLLAVVSLQSLASSKKAAHCTLYYSLSGLSVGEFSQQAQQLRTHLQQRKIALVDLNSWKDSVLSGREKMALRKKHHFPRNTNFAVLLDNKQQLITAFKHDVNLVSVLLNCPNG